MSDDLFKYFDSIKNKTKYDWDNHGILLDPFGGITERISKELGFTKFCVEDYHVVYIYNSVKVELAVRPPYLLLSAFPAKFDSYDDYMKHTNSNCLDIEAYLRVILLDGKSSKLDYKEEVSGFLDKEYETGGITKAVIKQIDIKELLGNDSIAPIVKIVLDLFDFAVDTDINKYTNGYAYL